MKFDQIKNWSGNEPEAKEKHPEEVAEVRKLLDIGENKGRPLYSKSCPNSLRNSLDSKVYELRFWNFKIPH